MAFPDIITATEYQDVRQALSFDASDTTTVPAGLIEGRLYGPAAEREARLRVTTWAAVIDSGDADYDADQHARLVDGVVLLTAATLAARWFARRAGEEIAEGSFLEERVKFRAPKEWMDVAEGLATDAATAIDEVLYWGSAITTPSYVGVGGPTRTAADAQTGLTTAWWEGLLWPEAVKGREF